MLTALEARLHAALRRGVRGLVGALFVAVGLGFLTWAAWVTLAAVRDPLFAAQVLGGLYLLGGGVLLILSRRQPKPAPQPAPPPATPAMLVEAFFVGLDAAKGQRSGVCSRQPSGGE
jgi:hypothetical protein